MKQDDENDDQDAPQHQPQAVDNAGRDSDGDKSAASEIDDDDDNSDDNFEPEYDKANSLPFATLCRRMEAIWALKRKKEKRSDLEKKQCLLPKKLLTWLEPQSVFPLFRLLMPDIDNARNTAMKEKLIAQAYCDAKGFVKGSKNYEMLYGFTDPQKVPHQMAGDLSLVVQHILTGVLPNQPSQLRLGPLNAILDELARISQRRRGSYNHEWRSRQNSTSSSSAASKKKKPEKTSDLREQWMRKIFAKGLSPLEHKWLVRMLLKKMEFALGWRAILSWYNPYALELWNSHNSLKNLCDKLADPEYTRLRKEAHAQKESLQQQAGTKTSRWEPQEQPAALGNTISPMLSSRVYFADCMTKLEFNHREYRKTTAASIRTCLAVQFPSICAEIKLDGERMVAHVHEGQVTVQTRNGKWYSQLYSPVIGPSIRRALSKYRVNVILDGEVEAWDDGRKEVIPFGSNRTVANARRAYLQRHGLAQGIDQDLHTVAKDGSRITDPNIMRVSDDLGFVRPTQVVEGDEDPGQKCWLQFVVFDILYLDGPDAKQLFCDCLMDDDAFVPGSIIHLTLLQRKFLLHRLLTEQPNEVEIGKAVVVRSNGDCVRAEHYFSLSDPLMDCRHLAALLDSTQTAIQECMPPNLQDLDQQRRKGRSDNDIDRLRTKAVEEFYTTVVEQHKMEGLVLKDLASPYILGQGSRSRKFWHKFKPDYEEGEGIDVMILGAFFATGLRHSGRLSRFMCGIVDENDPSSFMTVLSVNGKSISYEKLDKIMELTGYKAATVDEPLDMGKWFELDNHGADVPDFISHRSYQRGEEDLDGWTPSRKTYPDLWIKPEDSIVLELKGQEFLPTKEFSAGLTMRFPRIKYVRHEAVDGGTKSPYEADTHHTLYQLFYETMRQRQDFGASIDDSTFSPSATGGQAFQKRFLTLEEYGRKPKKRKIKVISPSKVPTVLDVRSEALQGVSFTVLEGNYSLDHSSLEAQDAKENGWLDEAMRVKSKEHIMRFILSHQGTIFVSAEGSQTMMLGGQANDARVIHCMKGIEYAKSQTDGANPKTKKARKLQEIAKHEGVLKWTFVFSIVYRWLADKAKSGDEFATIKKSSAWLLDPKAHDFLVKSSAKEGSNDHIFSLHHAHDTTKMDFLRALEEYTVKPDKSSPVIPWQQKAIQSFDPEERWCMSSQRGELWPYQEHSTADDAPTVILYPDIFRFGYGSQDQEEALEEVFSGESSPRFQEVIEDTNECVASVLPLASAMGAIVTPHFHSGVTHVLCGWHFGSAAPFFACDVINGTVVSEERGRALLKRLETIDNESKVIFVSSEWIHTQWRKLHDSSTIS